jgi:hypothetical protein
VTTRTLTEAQAFEAAMRFIKIHWKTGWTIDMLIDAADSNDQRDRHGTPVTFDPGEWQCWTECVDAVLQLDSR